MPETWRQILKQAAANLSVDLVERDAGGTLGAQGNAPRPTPEPGRDFEGRRLLARELARTASRSQNVLHAQHGFGVSSGSSAAYAVAPPSMAAPAPSPSAAPRSASWRNFAAVSFSGAILGLTGYAFLHQASSALKDAAASTSPQAFSLSASVAVLDGAKDGTQFIPAKLPAEAVSAPLPQSPGDAQAPAKSAITELQSATQKIFLENAANQLNAGDIAGARKIYELLAQHNSAMGAFGLAETYDPNVLQMHLVKGFAPNAGLARKWYQKAAALGSAEASERLRRLD
jgi:hypothetical protein